MKIKTKNQINYLKKITDQVGLIEHCNGSILNYDEGWCVDDNARALQVALRYNLPRKITDTYFNFLKKAWREEKLFNDLNKNLSWENNFLVNGEHCGRALFALGETIKNNYRKDESQELFNKIYNLIKKNKTEHLRMIAQTILGLQFYKDREIGFWADQLVEKYKIEINNDWYWFEDNISYDNGRIPMALLAAYKATKKEKYKDIGLESLDFLTKEIFNIKEGYFSFPGHNGWFKRNGSRSNFAQQPMEAGGMVEVYSLAFEVTKDKQYIDLAKIAFQWYEGRNIFKLRMINDHTGGIYDGLNEDKRVNQNQGAESVLSYLIAVKSLETISDLK